MLKQPIVQVLLAVPLTLLGASRRIEANLSSAAIAAMPLCLNSSAMNEPSDRILRIKTVLDRTGLSRSTLYRKVQNGTFPAQVRISTRCAGWRESAVNAWMRNPMFFSIEDLS